MRIKNSAGTTINQEWITNFEGTSIETSTSTGVTNAYRFAAKHRSFQSGNTNFDGFRNKAIIYCKNPHANNVAGNQNSYHNFNMEIHYIATNPRNVGFITVFAEDLALGYSQATTDTTTSSGKITDIQFFAQTSSFATTNFSSFHAAYYPLFTRLYDTNHFP